MASGWNIKFRKGGKSLCTIYPHSGCFSLMIVIGPRQKTLLEERFSLLSEGTQELYRETREGNGQRWLMIDIEDEDERWSDALTLLEIRADSLAQHSV